MKVITATNGKIGHLVSGPKHYLNEDIRLGEIAICISRDEGTKPFIWLISGCNEAIDYITLAMTNSAMSKEEGSLCLGKIEEAHKSMPKTALERLANIVSEGNVKDLQEMLKLAQVCITSPIEGIKSYETSTPEWSNGNK